MRQRLTELALTGAKVATAGLWQQDYLDEDEAIEAVGELLALLGDNDRVVAIIEVTRVETRRMCEVSWEFARAEGEGFTSIEHWRSDHTSYYAKHGVTLDDDTPFVCIWFRVVENRNAS